MSSDFKGGPEDFNRWWTLLSCPDIDENEEEVVGENELISASHDRFILRYTDPLLSYNEELHLIKQWQENKSGEARDRLVRANLRLVYSIERKIKLTYGIPWSSDFSGYGVEGLIEALERFDPSRGFRLSTFAVWRIKGKIFEGIAKENNWFTYVPETFRKVRSSHDRLMREFERIPTDEEIAKDLNISCQEVIRALEFSISTSTEELIEREREPSSSSLEDLTKAPLEMINAAVQSLPDLQKKVIQLFFFEEKSLECIAKMIGKTVRGEKMEPNHVKQIKHRAIKKLRMWFQQHCPDDFRPIT